MEELLFTNHLSICCFIRQNTPIISVLHRTRALCDVGGVWYISKLQKGETKIQNWTQFFFW